ncbi:helicase C-terminal domain-containing protein [Rhodococcus sp. Z13]|uniref:Helicase C-terminal domain-containing protein n=1 Tax=Rhodococcus sacchari TaxID=2962047 RepID=A0ACD4DI98_9NOCA|nr:helicase C-terminal domain-containing protein [Rhodococcus sp. Z13]UYP19690.1 helicase C-terminal domain-containing protein [Rhodococcus sp. Z13]
MPPTTPAPDSVPDSLALWLAGRRDSELAAALRARPDLVVPPPASMSVLASRAQQRASVFRAADELTTAEFGIIELLARAGAVDTPVPRAAVLEEIAGRTSAKNLDRILATLRSLLLVWGPNDALRLVPAAVDAVPWRVGRGEDTAVPAGTELDDLLVALPPEQRSILETLSRTSPVGRTRDAAPDTPADRPVQQLLAAGLLLRLDDETVELPHRVGQALRDDAPFEPAALTPPRAPKRTRAATDVNATAAGAALELLRHCENLLEVLGEQPAPVLRAGGLGVRELHRLGKGVGLDDQETALLVEVLAGAGLIARGLPDPPPASDDDHWAPTTATDAWLAASPAYRWAVLAGAWLDLGRRPWLVGRRDPNDKPIAALSDEVKSPTAARDRRLLLDVLSEIPADGPDVSALRAAAAWRRPRWAGRFDTVSVVETVREATFLGLVAHGCLASPGKALLHGGDAEAEMTAVLPEPVDHVLVQADLTVVAPGPLVPELAERIALVADIESAGAATVYRIGDASVRRALDAGLGASDLHTLFANHSRTPVPQSLTYLIDDVARRHGRLRAGVASSFVRADDPALLAEVLSSPVAATLALRAVAPTVAISQAPLADVLTELRAAGFAPAGEDASGAVVDLRPRGARVSVPRPRARYGGPTVPSDEQLDTLVRTLRAGDRAESASSTASARGDGSRSGGAATLALLQLAVHAKRSVSLGYVDAQGVATRRIVDPVSVGGGQLQAFDPATGSVRTFVLHRVSSVSLVD